MLAEVETAVLCAEARLAYLRREETLAVVSLADLDARRRSVFGETFVRAGELPARRPIPPLPTPTRLCRRCGNLCERKSNAQLYCPECAVIVYQQRRIRINRQYKARLRVRRQVQAT